MSTPYPDGGDSNAWFGKNSGGGGGNSSATTFIWIVVGLLIAIVVLGIAYYYLRGKGKCRFLCFNCKIECGSSHHGHSQSKC
ncbi:hypothetical protein GQ457_08G015800 [Hibiscus cannabinus]